MYYYIVGMKSPKIMRHLGMAASLGLAGLVGCIGGTETGTHDPREEILQNQLNYVATDLESRGYDITRDVTIILNDPVKGSFTPVLYYVQAINPSTNDWQVFRTSSLTYDTLKANRESTLPIETHPHLGVIQSDDTTTTLGAQIDAFEILPAP